MSLWVSSQLSPSLKWTSSPALHFFMVSRCLLVISLLILVTTSLPKIPLKKRSFTTKHGFCDLFSNSFHVKHRSIHPTSLSSSGIITAAVTRLKEMCSMLVTSCMRRHCYHKGKLHVYKKKNGLKRVGRTVGSTFNQIGCDFFVK